MCDDRHTPLGEKIRSELEQSVPTVSPVFDQAVENALAEIKQLELLELNAETSLN